MKKSLLTSILLNIAIGFVLLFVFYIYAFLSGFGSNTSHLPDEKRLFKKFIVFHLIVNFLFLWRLNQLNLIGICISLVSITAIYLIVGLQFDYFNN